MTERTEPADIVFGAPDLREEEIEEVVRTLRSGWIGTGPRVAEFERDFAAYHGLAPELAAAVGSCTGALHLSLLVAGIGPGDEVVTTPLTFCATVNAVLHAGATPVLCDVDPATMNIDVARLADCLTPRTKALLPVHFAGRPCEMDDLLALARDRGLVVVEDCAHAIEARWRGQPAGTLGDFGCFSFHPTKNLTTAEGGMVLAHDPAQLARVRRLAHHGLDRDAWRRFASGGFGQYDMVECGHKQNMTDLQAAIGVHQLRRLDAGWQRREAIWTRYQEAFADLPVTRPAPVPAHVRHAFHLYTLLIDERRAGLARDEFVRRMAALGIKLGVHYRAVGEHPWYQERLGWRPEATPAAAAIGRTTATLPLSPRLDDAAVDRVIAGVRGVLGH